MKKASFFKIIFASLFAIIVVVIVLSSSKRNSLQVTMQKGKDVKIGYFLGGRTVLLYRVYTNNQFEKEGTRLNLITKDLRQSDFYTLSKVPLSSEEIQTKKFGRVTGGELIGGVVEGKFDGATPGESSFIEAVSKGLPVMAVAMLGYDALDKPGHALIFRKDVVIKKPEDIKGKILATRRAGPGDDLFLREYLQSIGLDPDQDVRIIEDVLDDQFGQMLIDHKVDGGYYHLLTLKGLVEGGYAYVYRKLDWVNPELSHALLVFHKDFVNQNPEKVKKIIRAYMKQIKYEHGLPEQRDFEGMNIPYYDFPPKVQLGVLNQMQDLLLKHHFIEKKVDLSKFIDNRFVNEVYEELK